MTRISKNYKPTQKEKFMNAKMKEYFRQILVKWRSELIKESSQTINNLQNVENSAKSDLTDRASEEIDRTFELRTRDRERKLISKIDAALKRIEDGTYGYWLDTNMLYADFLGSDSAEIQATEFQAMWSKYKSLD